MMINNHIEKFGLPITAVPQNLPPLCSLAMASKGYQKETLQSSSRKTCADLLPDFDPSGSYHIKEEGYAKFDYFTLKVRQLRSGFSADGFAMTTDGNQFKFSSSVITKTDLTFKTAKKRGVYFEFNGKWLVNNVFAASNEFSGKFLLYGTLRRFEKKKSMVKIATSYSYQPNC